MPKSLYLSRATTRNGVRVATRNANKKPVWEMTREEQMDDKTVVFDFEELLEFAEGDISPVFGPQFASIDAYERRVRLPAREYLLVTRVTKMNAVPNEFTVGASMTTEYDLPVNGELSLGGDIPWAVLVESGQCDLMLISYMGIDFQCKSNRVYRLLDTTLIFHGVASEGETLRYDITVNGFAKSKGEVSMFFFSYDCYCNGRLLVEMRNGAAGFFTDAELDAGKGVVHTVSEQKARAAQLATTKALIAQNKAPVSPFLIHLSKKTTFSCEDMQNLVAGRWPLVFESTSNGVKNGSNPTSNGLSKTTTGEKRSDSGLYDLNGYRLTTPKMLMIDEIKVLNVFGGAHGLGIVVGEKHLDPEHWYFPCHFVRDQVMAGSLVSDGCSQLLKVFFIHLGLHLTIDKTKPWRFVPVNGQKNVVRCRGQISPHKGKLVYVMEIRQLGFDEELNPFAIADVEILDIDYDKGQSFEFSESEYEKYGKGDLSKKIVVDFKGIALKLHGTPNLDKDSKQLLTHSLNAHVQASSQEVEVESERKVLLSEEVPKDCLIGSPNVPETVTWHPFAKILTNGYVLDTKTGKKTKPPVPSFFSFKISTKKNTFHTLSQKLSKIQSICCFDFN